MGFLDVIALFVGIALFIWIVSKIQNNQPRQQETRSLEEERAYRETIGKYKAEKAIQSKEQSDREYERARRDYLRRRRDNPFGF